MNTIMTFSLPVQLREKLEELAKTDTRSVSWHIRQALILYINQSNKKQTLPKASA